MKVIVQRVKKASVEVENKIVGKINEGFMLLVGFTEGDDYNNICEMAKKIVNLRIMDDENGVMNKSILDTKGSILSISQFTLYADCKKGRRPSFIDAAKPEQAIPLYNYFNKKIEEYNVHVETGIFGADMKVSLLNDGPVTIILDSKEL